MNHHFTVCVMSKSGMLQSQIEIKWTLIKLCHFLNHNVKIKDGNTSLYLVDSSFKGRQKDWKYTFTKLNFGTRYTLYPEAPLMWVRLYMLKNGKPWDFKHVDLPEVELV